MSKRPNVFDLDSLMVKKTPAAAQSPATSDTPEQASEPVEPKAAPPRALKSVPPPAAKMFRTSVYFSRAVHDKLRDIAHEERKSITDLINEGLDHVLTSRNYPPTATLRGKAK